MAIWQYREQSISPARHSLDRRVIHNGQPPARMSPQAFLPYPSLGLTPQLRLSRDLPEQSQYRHRWKMDPRPPQKWRASHSPSNPPQWDVIFLHQRGSRYSHTVRDFPADPIIQSLPPLNLISLELWNRSDFAASKVVSLSAPLPSEVATVSP